MTNVLTLIAGTTGGLADDQARAASAALGACGARCGTVDWLDPGTACDIPFTALASAEAERLARAALGGLAIDLSAQPAEGRRKQVFVADMDSTIINVECIDELADQVGLKPRVAAITERAMRGELDFPSALRERVALLAGLSESVIELIWRERVRLNPGARELVQTMRASGAYTVLVSGGFRQFTQRVSDAAGFDEDRANRLEINGGRLTGRVIEPILGQEAKLGALNEVCARRGVTLSAALAVGDGANDAAMVGAAGLGVAYHAKPVLKAAARAAIDHGDLTALLFLQGYRRAEFCR
jgi:phosphoserine phosphatase